VDDEAVILLAMRQELRRRYGDRYSIETAMGADQGLRLENCKPHECSGEKRDEVRGRGSGRAAFG
jgi:hypothetical protein